MMDEAFMEEGLKSGKELDTDYAMIKALVK